VLDKIKGRKIMVVGLARSGKAAVKLLAGQGAREIIANDLKEPGWSLESIQKNGSRVKLVTGGNPPELITPDLSLLVKSPGIPPHLEIFKRARSLGIPVISEIELAYSFIKSPLIGITGTNGKTTTTMLTAALFEEGGWSHVYAAGNIGLPLCEITEGLTPGSLVAAEVSSFQLEDTFRFRPWVAVILNLTEDHLDHHATMKNYISCKSKILENQSLSDVSVFNADDTRVKQLAEKSRGQVIYFSREQVVPGFCISGGTLGLFWQGEFHEVCPLKELSLKGEHNLENALAASAAAWGGGVHLEAIGQVLKSFSGVEHRMETVREMNGVTFINDSKGTNPLSTIKALGAFPQKKVLIAGGKDKEADFSELARHIKKEAKFVVLLGETASRIAGELENTGFTSYEQVKNLEEGVKLAWHKVEPGEIVLLSPACASWDMFKDYEERGLLFKELVLSLKRK